MAIEQNLEKILKAVHGKDVRQAIHDGIHDCYEDGKAGAVDLVAREEIKNIEKAYGAPRVASSATEMTDTTKIYVYVGSESGYTSGNWYYYDGSAWVSGGVYNSVAFESDKTLSVEDMAADAKAVGNLCEITENLFNPYTFENKWYNEDGTIQTRTMGASSDFIPIVSGEFYVVSVNEILTNLGIAWFDSSHNYISRIVREIGNFKYIACGVAPVGATYAKAMLYNNVSNYFDGADKIINLQTTFNIGKVPINYVPYKTTVDGIARNNIDNILRNIEDSENLFNYDNFGTVWYNDDGTYASTTLAASSRLLPIIAGATYSAYTNSPLVSLGVVWFDEKRNFISRNVTDMNSGLVFLTTTAPQNAVYAICQFYDGNRFTTVNDLIEKGLQFSYGDVPKAYIKTTKSAKDEISRAYNGVGEYAGKKISLLGDSLTTFGGSASDDPTDRISDGTYTYAGNRCRYPQSDLLLDVHLTYWYKLITEFNMMLGVNESWAGSRVSWDGTTESADIGANKHIASVTRIKHLDDNGTPDIILVNAGTNDIINNVPLGTFDYTSPMGITEAQVEALPVDTFANAYRTLLIRLLYYYPTSKIAVLLPNYTSATYYDPQKDDSYCEIIKEACDYFGVPFVDMRTSGISIYNYPSYMGDGVHYNYKGMQEIYKKIKKFFINNFTPY